MVLTHSTSADLHVVNNKGENLFIPAGSQVMYTPDLVHRDVEYWKDPESFRPERWISEDGSSIINHSHYMPFGYGKRICVGEVAARNLMYLCTAALLQRYSWKLASFIPLDQTYQALNRNPPQNYELIFKPRF